MVECKDCEDYANRLLECGDIESQEINDLIIARHTLKNCDNKIIPKMDDLEFKYIFKIPEGEWLATWKDVRDHTPLLPVIGFSSSHASTPITFEVPQKLKLDPHAILHISSAN